MTKSDAKMRIQKAITTLNNMKNKVEFQFEVDEFSIKIICRSRTKENTYFGAYSYTGMFEEYKKKEDAYINCMNFVEMMVAATKLNNPNAYHNIAF